MQLRDTSENLRREIGTVGLAANVINIMIGAGIFVLPALVAKGLGPAAFLAYLVCGFLVMLIMLCFAEVGSYIVRSGGSYAYIEQAFGPFVGFVANSLIVFGFSLMADAAVANALIDTISAGFPAFKNFRIPAIILVFVLLSIVNIRGVRYGIRLVKLNTFTKLIPLCLLITWGWVGVEGENLRVSDWPSFSELGQMSLILFFAFAGAESALSVSGEIKNPKKTIPKGIFLGIGTVLVLYLLIQTVSQGVLGGDLINYADAPLVAAAEKSMGSYGSWVLFVGAGISMFGMLSGQILNAPRVIYSGAKSGLYPKFLAQVHPRFSTPYWAIASYAGFGLLFAIFGTFALLANLASAVLLITYLLVSLATLKFRLFNPEDYQPSFKVPGGVLIPSLVILIILWFLSNLKLEEAQALGIVVSFLCVFYTILYFLKRKA